MGSTAYSWTFGKRQKKAALKVIRLKSDASSFGISDIETLPHLTLAECPQGLSDASKNKLCHENLVRQTLFPF